MKRSIIILLASVFLLGSCKDLLDPAIENNRQLDPDGFIPNDARFPFGVLLNGSRTYSDCNATKSLDVNPYGKWWKGGKWSGHPPRIH